MKTKQKLNYNDLVLKWPLPFRNTIKIDNGALGVQEFTIEGKTKITAKDLENMKNDGYIFQKIDVYEYDSVLLTTVTFREYHKLRRWKMVEEAIKKVLKRKKPQQTRIDAGACDSVCCGDVVGTDHPHGDDTSL